MTRVSQFSHEIQLQRWPIFAEFRTGHSRHVAIELADLHSSDFGRNFSSP